MHGAVCAFFVTLSLPKLTSGRECDGLPGSWLTQPSISKLDAVRPAVYGMRPIDCQQSPSDGFGVCSDLPGSFDNKFFRSSP